MKIIILLPSLLLFLLEWFIIRHTSIKSYVPILITFLIGLPIGLFYGLHLVAFPMFVVLIAYLFCKIEDEVKKYFNRKGMTEEEKAMLKDL